ncbi:non-ribosomal peptide synthetase [Alkaliphilus peptidifermentans]|uniref:Non-ribosomal peptide synthase domain TIGR01720/amino acid adenylation domain-containing protein n=1 Tax=Alkaliphilus peptidifermentans DSM 18978 TaxID=1120976 RepID=A0A1G5I281_9FIRM|nr:non-ribosomal peptide synthetase [Alkaliphilus peptidifermentans]SCY70225.1 non-ribosomal peptide synthase domain TIGR01720/amino acid adenylation domain-containing protein [Alkaliphilus peptidifermentans DSM 18978]
MDRDITLYPLTHPQKRVWYIEKIYPSTSVNNISGTVRAEGKIDYKVLERAIDTFVEANDGVRIQLKEVEGEGFQYIEEFVSCHVDFFDFSNSSNPEEDFNAWACEESKIPFILEDSPLYYFAIFKINEGSSGYYVKFHHIVCDGWSIKLMTEQISQAYNSIINNEEEYLEKKPSYLQYVINEKAYLTSDKIHKNREFWTSKFSEVIEGITRGKINNFPGKRKSFHFNKYESKEILEYVKENSISLNTLFTAATLIYLSIAEQRNDITVGIPVLNRSGKIEKSIVGMFTSTVPLRIKVDEEEEIYSFIQKIKSEMKKCLFHQKYPYNLLVQDLQLKKKGYDNLFDVCINYYNTKLESRLEGIPLDNKEIYNGRQIYPLQIVIKEWYGEGKLTLEFDYQQEHYNEGNIEDLFLYINKILKSIISNAGIKLKDINILSEEQVKYQLWDYNDTVNNYDDNTIDQMFEEEAQKTPDKIAVSYKERQLTYKELKMKSDKLASFLLDSGVEKGEIVGLMTNHSIETIIGILGIMKAGAAFLPIDSNYPPERIKHMLEECSVSTIVSNCKLNNDITLSFNTIQLDNPEIYKQILHLPARKNKLSDIVYVIYTSGSTGKPKGVHVQHRGLVNYIKWAQKTYVKNETEVFPLYSSLTFDLTITSIFLPLISGGKIIIYRDEDDTEYVLYRVFKDKLATIVKLTPSQLSLIKDMDNGKSTVKRLIVGGEDLKVSLAKSIYESFQGDIEIFNEYGPTETVVGCMIHRFDIDRDTGLSVPIGKPIDNVQIYILDKYMRLLPPGSVGELYVSGDGVARGYMRKQDLTDARFITNPFIKGKRMYKTGDLAKLNLQGNIEFVGRADRQVKIRGHRIELGEIENSLLSFEAIENAVVSIRQQANGDKYLCGYIVEKIKVDLNELKDYLSQFLFNYAIPEHWIYMDNIPLTKNGKVDYNMLPEPEIVTNKKIVEPRNSIEKVLLEYIVELIGVEAVGMKDNFFHIGGDSIKAIQLSSRLQGKGYKIRVEDILSKPLLEEMALCILEGEYISKNNNNTCEGSIKASPITEWFFAQNLQNPDCFTQSVMVNIRGGIDENQFNDIFQKLIQHHDILRVNYDPIKKELYYNNRYLNNNFKVAFYDLSKYTVEEQKKMLQQISTEESGFNIERDILIKACLFYMDKQQYKLFIKVHHLAIDGVSWRILIDDISTAIEQLILGREIELPSKTSSYSQWCEEINRFSIDKALEKEKSYWQEIVQKEITFPAAGKKYFKSSTKKGLTITAQLTEDETANLVYRANRAYNTKVNELLIISLVMTIAQLSGSSSVVLELESHGREHSLMESDLTRTVGWFTSMFPTSFKAEGIEEMDILIKSLKEQIREIPYNGIGYGILRYLKKQIQDNYENTRLRFNYMGDMDDIGGYKYVKDAGICFSAYSDASNILTCPMVINALLMEDKLTILATYDEKLINTDKCKEFINLYVENISKIVDYCISKDTIQYTVSDFDLVKISQEELNNLIK